MKFNGKKFSELILEQEPGEKEAEIEQAYKDAKISKSKFPFKTGYEDLKNARYDAEEDVWTFPEITVLANKPKIRTSIKINFNTGGSVDSVDINKAAWSSE